MNIDEIRFRLNDEFGGYERFLKASLSSEVDVITGINEHIAWDNGKKLRPMLIFLSAKMFGAVDLSVIRAAAMIEILHVATLIHDDVVDNAVYRRGEKSINALWTNKVAVLMGDFLLAKAMKIAVDTNALDILGRIIVPIAQMSEGEIIQQQYVGAFTITEDIYIKIITKKTASLMASCSSIGAMLGGADVDQQEQMRLIGECLGIAFQIKDDLLDIEKNTATGKGRANDILERKITLPFIFALQNAPENERQIVSAKFIKDDIKADEIEEIIEFIYNFGGYDYAVGVMDKYCEEGLALLGKMPHSEYKNMMVDLFGFIAERNK